MAHHGSYHFPRPRFSSNTQYIGLPDYGDEPSPDLSIDYYKQDQFVHQAQVNLQSNPQLRGRRSWTRTAGIQLCSFLWTVPIGLLLYFNLHGWVLGASVWCPGKSCLPQVFNPITSIPQVIAVKNDRNNHNLLGALQLVAKALEVWFILIASWLVYLITMFLASRKGGLPIAYVTRPNEFADLPGLLDPLLWKTLPRFFATTGPKQARKRVWLFVIFTIFLCVLCNLMGPATAVLVLPSLQWLKTHPFMMAVFLQLNSATKPVGDGIHFLSVQATDCTPEAIANNAWNCTSYPFAAQLDGWVESYVASFGAVNGITSQGSLSFGFNSTEWVTQDGRVSDFLSWAPSRQTMQGLDNDFWIVQQISNGSDFDTLVKQEKLNSTDKEWYDALSLYNNTVATHLQRDGPVVGVAANMWLGYDNETWWDTMIDETRDTGIRCYNNCEYRGSSKLLLNIHAACANHALILFPDNISNTPLSRGVLHGTYTKCVKWGKGWNMDYSHQSFTIKGLWKENIEAFGPQVLFDIWTSDRAAFYPDGQLPAGLSPDCLPPNAVAPSGCDWDAFFAITDDSILATRSQFVNTIHLQTQYEPSDGHPTSMDLMFDFVAYLNFSTYRLDPSPVSNPLALVTFPDLPMSGKAVAVDPTWMLAAWSAPNSGSIPPGRSAAIAILNAFEAFWTNDLYTSPDPLLAIAPYPDIVALVPIIQALSIIDQELDDSMTTAVDEDHPLLLISGRMNVWAYGMSSRSSWFAVAVTMLGGGVVLLQFLLGILDRRPYRSPMELLVAALEHAPNEEFRGKNHDEVAIAQTPFTVEDRRKGHASAFEFRKVS